MANKTITAGGTSWTGTAKRDNVYIYEADDVSVNTGAGNDSIKNSYNYAWDSTIDAGNGNDTITFDSARYSSINAGAGNDKISLSGGSYLTIKGGKGNDTVYASANYNLYQYASGDGNDIIYGLGSTDTISITGAKYTKKTSGDDVILTVGKGKITLVGARDKAFTIKGTLDGGGKNINNSKAKKLLTGTSYADTITNSGSKVTISGGKGNDSITNTGSRVSINSGDGNDWIFNEIVGYSAAGSLSTISTGAGDDTLSNDGAKASISTGTGNDSVLNYGADSKINLGDGDDKIINQKNSYDYGSNVSINGGKGNDSITNYGDTVKIVGDSGNDLIFNEGSNVTISGGTGNDTLEDYGTNTLYKYASGDGNDVIYGFGEDDMIKITGAKYTKKTSGNDVILTVGKGKITLKDAKGKTLNIDGTLSGKLSIPTDAYTYNGHSYYIFNNKSTWEEAKTYCESRGGHLAIINNAAENSALFNYMKSKGYDSAYFGLSDAAKEGTWTWANGDKVSYTNWGGNEPNGGTSTVTVPADIVPADTVPSGDVLKGTSGHDNLYNARSSTRKVIYAYDGNDTVDNRANNVYISGSNGNDYIENWYGSNSTVHGDAGADNITVKSNNAFIYGGAGDDTITAYRGKHLTLSGGVGNDYLWGGTSSDTLIGGSGDDIFVYKPNQGTDHITDFSGGDMLKILKSNGNEGGTFTSATYSGGNLTLAISGGGSVVLDNVSSGQSININGTNYKISGKTLK